MEDTRRIGVIRWIGFLLIISSIALITTSIITDNWFELISAKIGPDKRVLNITVLYQKGLWNECIYRHGVMLCGKYGHVKTLTLRKSIHPQVPMEPVGYIEAVRGFMITSLVTNCLTVATTFALLAIKKRFYMDVQSFLTLVTNMFLVAGLSLFTYWNQTTGYPAVRAGFSQILAWMAFTVLLVANMCSFIGRLNPERARKEQALYA